MSFDTFSPDVPLPSLTQVNKKGDRAGDLVVIFYLDRKSHLLPSNSELHKALGNDIY